MERDILVTKIFESVNLPLKFVNVGQQFSISVAEITDSLRREGVSMQDKIAGL